MLGNFNARIINPPFVLLQRRCENDPKNQASQASLTLKVSSLDPYYENDIELVACFHSRHEDFILAQGGVNHPWVPLRWMEMQMTRCVAYSFLLRYSGSSC